jgi:hypothetical protein
MCNPVSGVSGLLHNAIEALELACTSYCKTLAVTDGAAALVGYESAWAMASLAEAAIAAGLDPDTVKAAIEAGKARAEVARQYRESTPPPKRLGSWPDTAKRTTASIIEFDEPTPTKLRLRELWLAAMAVRDKGDRDELQQQFMEYAQKSGLVKAASEHYAAKKQPHRWGEEDVAHIISWGLRGMDPWCPGEFPNG